MQGDTLRLDLAVSPTLAFYTWHSFVQTSLPGVEALTTVWRLLTMSYVKYRDCSITISQQKQLLSDIAAAPPTEVLQSVDLAWKPSMQMPYWFDSPQAIQKPLLFLQLLLLTAHEVACHPAVTSGRGMRPSDDSEMAQVLVIASPHMPKTLTEPNSKWGESSHPVVALRSALLVLKLMTSAVADSTRTLRTLGALWDAVQKIADNLDMHNCGNYPNPIGCQPVGPPLCEEVEEEVHLCRLVTSLLLGLMKQDLKGARSHTTTICALLAAITITKGPASQAVFSELLHTGVLLRSLPKSHCHVICICLLADSTSIFTASWCVYRCWHSLHSREHCTFLVSILTASHTSRPIFACTHVAQIACILSLLHDTCDVHAKYLWALPHLLC